MEYLIFAGVNAVLLILLLVAIALLRAPAAAKQRSKRAATGAKAGGDTRELPRGDLPQHESVEESVSSAVDTPELDRAKTAGAIGNAGSNGMASKGSVGAPFEVFTFGEQKDAALANGSNGNTNGVAQNGAMNGETSNGDAQAGSASVGKTADRPGAGELAAYVSSGHEEAPNVANGSQVFAVDRPAAALPASSICLDAHLDGDRPARDALVGRVIDELTPLGFVAERLTPSRSRLRSADGRMVAITARPLTPEEDRIEIVLDTALAGQAFTALRQWHRVELGGTDQVRLSARIR